VKNARSLVAIAFLVLGTAAYAQPNLPSIFEFPVDLSARPELAKADAVDVRIRLRDAKDPERILHEEVFKNIRPDEREKERLRLRLGFHKRLKRDLFLDRTVICETAARPAGEGDFVALGKPSRVRLVFEKPKTLAEKVKLDRWVLLGVAGQILFMMRFLIQWIESERRRESTIPVAFWWCSLGGGLIVLAYGLIEREPIIILGQSCAFLVYMRNLYFIYEKKKREGGKLPSSESIT